MKALIDEYKGWAIWGEWQPAERFVETVSWTAEKEGETVTLEASALPELIKLIEMRETHHG